MDPEYRTERCEKRIGKTHITITSISPVYPEEEEETAVRKKIEVRLYEIFRKYVSEKR